MNKEFLQKLKNPGSRYRGAPFWAWNGKLDEKELRRQIRLMKRMGLGGFFMHSRIGLDTPYLSNQWFKCVEACADESKKMNMQVWLYDEDRWPSGAAGGIVTKNPKFRGRSLILKELKNKKDLKWNKNTIAAFTAKINGTIISNIKQIHKGNRSFKLAKNESILLFSAKINSCNNWYNGYTYLDTMSHKAVQEFIKVTHEAYKKHVGTHFGKLIPGIFTDEPNYGGICIEIDNTQTSMPWTESISTVFKKRYGYNLIKHLPELFFDLNGIDISKARYHYFDCITHLFVDAFARQIGEWCEKNNLQHTGHVLSEATLLGQTNSVGSCMRFYEYMQAPGMDILTEYKREYDTAKQVSSVARQFGRKWRLTETYGCTGWDFPFLGHKAIGDWQVALGINLRAQHLSWYTMEGQAKRDYPASIFYQSPWWEIYSKVEDYFARIHAVMTRGSEIRDLLVIHPNESMWLLCKKQWTEDPAVQSYDKILIALRDSLLSENIDFDYGDEDIIARHGKTGKQNGTPIFTVGKAGYKAVMVPTLKTMRSTTLKLLQKFHTNGGTIVFSGKPAEYLDALPSDAVTKFAQLCTKVPTKGIKCAKAVSHVARRLSIIDNKGNEIMPILHLLREDKDAFYLFICNTGYTKNQLRPNIDQQPMIQDRLASFQDVRVIGFSECSGHPVEIDTDTGSLFKVTAKHSKSGWEIHTSLPILGSRIFIIPKKKSLKKYPLKKTLKNVRTIKYNNKIWNISLSESNCLMLDNPEYKINTGKYRKAKDILAVDSAIRDFMSIPHRGGQMVQPWARKLSSNLKRVTVELTYEFYVSNIPCGDIFLAMERPATFNVTINKKSVSMDTECGWWCDKSLRKIPISTAILQTGLNKINLKCNYDENHPGLEIIYLLGNFGVKVNGSVLCITNIPTQLKIGNWVTQGLPFYSGTVCYNCSINPKLHKGEHLFVHLPDYHGAASRILVNGETAGIIAWHPNEVDITSFIGTGKNNLRIEIFGNRRNSHGPFHQKNKKEWVGPENFILCGNEWSNSYQLVSTGMIKQPQLIIKK